MTYWQLPLFEELRELGSGGSGRVVLARHLPTGTEVAIKYLADWLSDDADLLAGFRAEAELMAGLVDPHLVTLYEYVETTSGAAIVMDVLDGVSLRRMLLQDGPLSPEAALTLLKGSLLGLAALHRQGIAHRDYKPDNVIVDDAGGTTLIDYGIAAPVGEVAEASGTPRYMAPEQWRGEASSAATDVYAATATFVECLTGRPVFDGETVPRLLQQHLHAPPPLDDVPEAVRPLALAGLAKDPAERVGDATALVERLDALAPAAYGPRWEQHGRAHLAARAALLAFLFAHPRAVGIEQASAQTDLGGSSATPGGGGGAAGGDAGETIGSAVGSPPRQAGVRGSARAALRSPQLTLGLAFLLLLAAVFAALRSDGSSAASAAAFEVEAPTQGVVSGAPSPHPPSPTPSAVPSTQPTPTSQPPPSATPSATVPTSRPTATPTPYVTPTTPPTTRPTRRPVDGGKAGANEPQPISPNGPVIP